jgi:hypothetical protein
MIFDWLVIVVADDPCSPTTRDMQATRVAVTVALALALALVVIVLVILSTNLFPLYV